MRPFVLLLLAACSPAEPSSPSVSPRLLDTVGQLPLFPGSEHTFVVTDATPGTTVTLFVGQTGGEQAACPDICLDLDVGALAAAGVRADERGHATLLARLPAPIGPVAVQALTTGGKSNLVRFELLDPGADPDGDGLDNLTEAALRTAWNQPDTDGDGLDDGDELHPLDPALPEVRQVEITVLSDPRRNVWDLEIDALGQQLLWAEDDGSSVWVAQLDLDARTVQPRDLRGALIATDTAPFELFQNGPEWVEHPDGSQVLYCKLVDGLYHLFRAEQTEQGWASLDDGLGAAPLGSAWQDGTGGWFTYVVPDPRADSGLGLAWRNLDEPGIERSIPDPLYNVRFLPGGDLAVGTLAGAVSNRTAALDPLTGTLTPLTQATTNRVTAFPWRAPERGDRAHTTSTIGRRWAFEYEIEILELTEDGWRPVNRILPPPTLPNMALVHPFVRNDRSWVHFIATELYGGERASELWVTNALPDQPFSRRLVVDDTATMRDFEHVAHGDQDFLIYRVQRAGIWTVELVEVGQLPD